MTDGKRSKITDEHREEAARLKAIWDDGRAHRTQAVFGEHYGLGNQANVGHYLNARSALNVKAAMAFAAELGCNVTDFSRRIAAEIARMSHVSEEDGLLSFSTSPKPVFPAKPATGISSTDASQSSASPEPPDLVLGEFLTSGGALGTKKQAHNGLAGRTWRVSSEWLRLNAPDHTGTKNLFVVIGFGRSMKGSFNPGDPLLLDVGVKAVDHEGIYFFRVGNEGFIQMIQRVPDFDGPGYRLRVLSTNTEYPSYELSPRNPHFEVFGKVLTILPSNKS